MVAEPPVLEFAGLLRQLRTEAGLTQEELAEAAGLSPRSVSDLERGINRTARKDTAVLLAGALGLADPVRAVFVSAARGRGPAAEVLAARRHVAGETSAAGEALYRVEPLAVSGRDELAEATRVPARTVPRQLPVSAGFFVAGVQCGICHRENPADAKFCIECGGRLGATCGRCAAQVPSGAKFCPECGRSVGERIVRTPYTPAHLSEKILASRGSLEGERKLVTVLFCDIVRSEALTERLGPEDIHLLLDGFFRTCAEQVHRYEGTINQFLGDGFMALFGAPIAHEDHARRAVLAALGLREALGAEEWFAGVAIRLGINTGEVVIGAIGDDLRMDYTAFGETTILAAHLQAAAEAGEILVGESTARIIEGYFELGEGSPARIKETELRPLRVVREGTRRSRLEGTDRRLSPFIGHARDLAVLQSLSSGDGGGQIVGLVGEPVIGKSRLVYEFQ